MKVTAIRPDPRAPHLSIIEVDGARFALVPAAAVRDLGLERGLELDEQKREELDFLADVEASYRVAVRLLASRPRAVNEMLRKLRERGHNPSAAARAVGRLEDCGVLDDAEYARHHVRVRSARGHGRFRLLTDLLAKGVDRRLAERAIDEVLVAEEFDELGQARAVAEKRLSQLGSLPRGALKRRLMQYLARRGFRGYEVSALIDELVSRGAGFDGQ